MAPLEERLKLGGLGIAHKRGHDLKATAIGGSYFTIHLMAHRQFIIARKPTATGANGRRSSSAAMNGLPSDNRTISSSASRGALPAIDSRGAHIPAGFGSPGAVGKLLLEKFLIPFEAASFLLLIAAVGERSSWRPGVMATIVMVLAFNITHGSAQKYFVVVLGLAISTTTIAYLFIYPAIIRLRYTHPEVKRPYRIPGGTAGVWLVGVITTAWALLATVVLVWPGFGVGWFGTSGSPDASLPSGLTRLEFEKTQIVPLLVLVAVGVLFYVLGTQTRQQEVDVPQSVLEAEETIVSLGSAPA